MLLTNRFKLMCLETFTGASLEGEPMRLLCSKVTKPEVVMAVTKRIWLR